MRSFLMTSSSLAIAAAFALQPTAAFAQQQAAAQSSAETGADDGNAIIVTARKRSETLQDTPLSIQALSAKDIERSNISDLSDIAAFAPGVSLFENTDRGYGQVFIRGMQSTPPVGDTSRELASVFIDGVYYVGGVSAINTDNIERVEVIKGPQSALYGRSTFSGAINFITKTPGDTFKATLRGKAATDDNYEVNGSIEAPIASGILAARISGMYRTYGGQYSNQLNNAPLGEERDWSLSGDLHFTPSPNFTAKLKVMYLDQDDGPPATVLTGKKPVHNFTSASGATFYRGVLKWDGIVAQNVFPSSASDVFGFAGSLTPFTDFARIGRTTTGLSRSFLFTSADLKYQTDSGYAINYLGSYSRDMAVRLYDFDFSRENNYFGSRKTNSDANSHELRISSPSTNRFRWLAGGFYMRQKLFERDPGGIFGPGVFGALGITANQVVVGAGPRTIVNLKIVNKAVFGSFDFDATDKFTISVEGRYQSDDLTDPNFPKQTTNAFLPRAILQYKASPDVMIYASAAKGLRPTVINSQFIQRSATEQAALRAAFPQLSIQATAPKEQIWSYELGAKTTLMDGRLTFNINGYYSDWQDRQDLQSLLFNFGSGIASTLVTVSGSDVEAYGIEASASMAVTPEFSLTGNLAWNHSALIGPGSDANIARFALDPTPNGERLPQVPKFSGTIIGDYRMKSGLFVRAEGVYVGSRFADTLNLAETGASFNVNLRIGFAKDNYKITFFADNLFNDMTFESLRSNADCATTSACSLRAYEAVLPRQRQFGVILESSF